LIKFRHMKDFIIQNLVFGTILWPLSHPRHRPPRIHVMSGSSRAPPPATVGPSPSPRLSASLPSRLHKIALGLCLFPSTRGYPATSVGGALLCLPSRLRRPCSTYDPRWQHPSSTSPWNNSASTPPLLHAGHPPPLPSGSARWPPSRFPSARRQPPLGPYQSAGRPPPAGIDTPLSFIFLLDGWFCRLLWRYLCFSRFSLFGSFKEQLFGPICWSLAALKY
jgi:hypothetical protein